MINTHAHTHTYTHTYADDNESFSARSELEETDIRQMKSRECESRWWMHVDGHVDRAGYSDVAGQAR